MSETATSEILQALWGTLATDGATGSVRFERSYPTTTADLWETVTSPTRISRWFSPVDGELRPGGHYRVDMGSDGVADGRILACDPGRSYRVSWEELGTQESEIEVTVRADGDGAVLVLHHRRLPAKVLAEYGAGWQGILERIGTAADDRSGGTAAPSDDRYTVLLPAYQAAAAAAGVPEWAADIDGVLNRRDGLPAVRFDRRYPTSAEDLWAAVTDPERLARWFMPVSGDLREGGEYTVDYGPDGTGTGTVLTCDPGRGYVVSWQIDGADAGVVSVEILTGAGDPLLRLNHVKLPEAFAVGYAAGWHAYLDRLADDLAGEPLTDFDQRWDAVMPAYRRLGTRTPA